MKGVVESQEMSQALNCISCFVSLRNLKRNNKEGNLKGIFHKSIPAKQLYNVCLVSFFFSFFFSLFKVSSLGTQKTLLHAVMQEIPFTAYFYSGE